MSLRESNPNSRRAMGLYPPQPGDFFAKPPYSVDKTCEKMGSTKTFNMDVNKICGKKKKH